ncbi:MAG: helix-turn-helix transcriptional regulator [Bacilli bacterium]|nr:helix-turn-helix transcriptional regulator [Bacilli bacterium]
MDYKNGERLTKYRKLNGYSQEALAEKLGVSRQAVSKRETGESAPDTENLIALSKLYNVKIDDLINTDPEDLKQEEVKQERVTINRDGIHVISDEAEVKLDKDGIFVNGKKRDLKDDDFDEDHDDDYKIPNKLLLFRKIFDSAALLIVVVTYLLLGFFLPDGLGWQVYWTLFFIPIIIDSIISAILSKKVSRFNIAVFVTFAFLFVGMRFGIWHPTWVEFLAIPIFYSIVKPIEKYSKQKKDDKVIDVKIED